MNAIKVLDDVLKKNFNIPVVMVSGEGDEEVAVRAMKRGAYDYVVKNERYPANLPIIIGRAIKKHRSDKEKERLYEEIRGLKEYLEKIYNTVADPIYVLDHEGRFVDWYKMGEEITGYRRKSFWECALPRSLPLSIWR